MRIRGCIFFHHGIAEHSSRYAATHTILTIASSPPPIPPSPLSSYHEPAVHLASKGFLVSAYDAQGHGRSQGLDQCYFRKLSDLIDDAFTFMETIMKKRAVAAGLSDFKPFIWGQSFGGLVLCRAAELRAVSEGRSKTATTSCHARQLYRPPSHRPCTARPLSHARTNLAARPPTRAPTTSGWPGGAGLLGADLDVTRPLREHDLRDETPATFGWMHGGPRAQAEAGGGGGAEGHEPK